MSDRYASVAELQAEVPASDYAIVARPGRSAVLVLAPHGGGIEAGTSELADAVAGDQHAFYSFQGLRVRGNAELHVTSARFAEPACAALLAEADRVLALHGARGSEPAAYVGGRDAALRAALIASLQQAGFVAAEPTDPTLLGEHPRNVCNRGRSGAGAQVELTRGLRAQLFVDLGREGRRQPTPAFARLVAALRAPLASS